MDVLTVGFLPSNIKRGMKYVCSTCGAMLSVDRDLDDDRTVDSVISRHRFGECPGDFPSESSGLNPTLKGSGQQAAS